MTLEHDYLKSTYGFVLHLLLCGLKPVTEGPSTSCFLIYTTEKVNLSHEAIVRIKKVNVCKLLRTVPGTC